MAGSFDGVFPIPRFGLDEGGFLLTLHTGHRFNICRVSWVFN